MTSKAAQLQIPRTGSAKWGRPQQIHIARPMSQQSLDLDLTVTGTPTPGLDQESSRALRWPLAHLQHSGNLNPRVPKSTAWRTDNELFEQVKEKLTMGYEGVRQMFRAKDPYGDFIVTQEGLFLILKSLVGHISRDQFNSFLKSICLHWRSSISFDEFIIRFQDNRAVAMHLIEDLTRKHQKKNDLEQNLYNKDRLEWCPFTTAPHAYVVFQSKLQKGEVNIHDLLPATCFTNDGRVIKPHLRDAISLVGLQLTDTEFDHVWLKFDPDNNGSVPIKKIYKLLSLLPNGLPKSNSRAIKSAFSLRGVTPQERKSVQRCKTEMHMTTNTRQSTAVSKLESVEIHGKKAEILGFGNDKTETKLSASPQNVTKEVTTTTKEDITTKTTTTTTTTTTKTTSEKREEQIVDDSRLSSHVRALIQAKKAPPQFDSVMDHLHYKFEETYRNLHSAFRLFDFMHDGYIAKIDFRRVLKEFGFEIAAIDLDAFLIRSGVSVVQGLINYNQFLQKFQSKGESSIISQFIVQIGDSLIHNSYNHIKTEEAVRSEKMVENVASFFHSDYLTLLGLLKQKDKNNTGAVPAHELRSVINSVLKIKMSDKQFDELIQRLSEKSSNGSPQLNYSAFLNLFNTEPGQWNKYKDGLFSGQKYQLGEIAPAASVMRLLEKSKTWMTPPAERDVKSNSRVAEIKRDLTRLFTDRFHVFDKNFQDMDRKKTNYMSKWQFGALIKLFGITLTISDLEHLWSTLDTAADNTLSYATLVKTFCSGQQQKHLALDKPSTAKTPQKSGDTGRQKTAALLTTKNQLYVVTGSAKERKLTELLKKVERDVMKRWDVLYSIFMSLDHDGYSSISVQDMQDIAYKLKLPLSSTEREELCNFFDLHGNGWFHYLSFLNAVKKLSPGPEISPCVFNIHTKRLHKAAGPTSMAITVYDFMTELKGVLLKKFKTLRGSFKFFDHNRNGFIEEGELRKSLTALGYTLSSQDFFDILHLFDRSQGQKLSYEDFKNTLLTV